MLRARISAAGLSMLLTIGAAAPAFAGYGALAYDESAQKWGLSSNEEAQGKADDVALKICGSDKCKIIFRTKAHQCGAIAIATAAEGKAWGAAYRGGKPAAELAAMNDCQKHTPGQCKVRASECNR